MKTNLSISIKAFLLSCLLVLTIGCQRPELDRPIVTGNTLDQWNRLDKTAPDHANVNISYEFEYRNAFLDEETNEEVWVYKGRVSDRLNRYVLAVYSPLDDNLPPGQVITQGRLRMTSYDACISSSKELDEKQSELFSKNITTMASLTGETGKDMFIRRFVSNITQEGSRQLEIVFIVLLDEEIIRCNQLTEDFLTKEEIFEILSGWKDEGLRTFEIIG